MQLYILYTYRYDFTNLVLHIDTHRTDSGGSICCQPLGSLPTCHRELQRFLFFTVTVLRLYCVPLRVMVDAHLCHPRDEMVQSLLSAWLVPCGTEVWQPEGSLMGPGHAQELLGQSLALWRTQLALPGLVTSWMWPCWADLTAYWRLCTCSWGSCAGRASELPVGGLWWVNTTFTFPSLAPLPFASPCSSEQVVGMK